MRFSENFDIDRTQAELDFVDIPLDTDMRVFIDPYAVAVTKSPWCQMAHDLACNFFQCVLDRLREGDRDGALSLLSHLPEDNRTRLGYSKNDPQGTGFGNDRAGPFLDALQSSEAFQTGQIEDIEDTALFVERVGFDMVSDMMTNVLRELLVSYTLEQCAVLGIPTPRRETFEAWRANTRWTRLTADFPTDGTRAIILVPRAIVRKNLSLQPNQYLTDFLDNHCDRGDRTATESLERMLQRHIPMKRHGKVKRTDLRKELKEKGSIKNIMARISRDCPDALRGYKIRAREKRPVLTPGELESIHPQRKDHDISGLISEMRDAARNTDDAMGLARKVTAGMLAAFHPIFQHPRLLNTQVNGFAGVLMSNTAAKGPLWNARHNGGRDERPNVVVLASSTPITEKSLGQLDAHTLRAATNSGLIVLIGPSLGKATRVRRKAHARTGLVIISISELADITEAGDGADALSAIMAT